jgi:hypothetical protein
MLPGVSPFWVKSTTTNGEMSGRKRRTFEKRPGNLTILTARHGYGSNNMGVYMRSWCEVRFESDDYEVEKPNVCILSHVSILEAIIQTSFHFE